MPFAASLAVSQSTMDTYKQQFRNQGGTMKNKRSKPLLTIQTETPKRIIRDQHFPLPEIDSSGRYGSARRRSPKSPKSPKWFATQSNLFGLKWVHTVWYELITLEDEDDG